MRTFSRPSTVRQADRFLNAISLRHISGLLRFSAEVMEWSGHAQRGEAGQSDNALQASSCTEKYQLPNSGQADRSRATTANLVFWGPPEVTTAYIVDVISAVDAAVADGCNVISLSIGGPATAGSVFLNALRWAYKGAAAAGVSVVAPAGNDGPDLGSMGGNVGPWMTTVAANTHNRQEFANMTLGDGRVFNAWPAGFFNYAPLNSQPLVWAGDVGLPGVNNSQLCMNGTLDHAKVTGKIVVCLAGRAFYPAMGAEVAFVGGVGMVILKPDSFSAYRDDTVESTQIPTLYIPQTDAREPIKAYAASAGAVASFSEYRMSFDQTAPRVAEFSSRGPVLGEPNLLKPDISAPGVHVVAPSSAKWPLWQVSGSSPSSSYLAGLTALVKQAHPDWSPMMIKSAIMTTAYQTTKTGPSPGVLLNSTTPFSVGAGFADATAALNPGLVFDSSNADWNRFVCGTGEMDAASVALFCPECASDQSLCEPANLNGPSVLVAKVPGVQSVRRIVTSVLSARADFVISSLEKPPGFDIAVSPAAFSLEAGASQSLTIKFTRLDAKHGDYRFGSVTWSSSQGTVTRIPLVAAGAALVYPLEVSVAPRRRNTTYLVTPGYTGTFSSLAVGLEPAKVFTDTVLQDPDQKFDFNNPASGTTAVKVAVPPQGGQLSYLRVALFDADYPSGTDLDLFVYDDAGNLVGKSESNTAQEQVSILNPRSRSYTVYVNGWAVPGGQQLDFKLHTWVLRMPSTGSSNTRASPSAGNPAAVTIGLPTPVSLSFSARLMAPAQRWLGMVLYAGDGLPKNKPFLTLISLF